MEAMTITTLDMSESARGTASKTKLLFIFILFLLSLVAFVTQTEFTSQAYQSGFKEPIILLYITHGLWWILWPIQAFFASIWKTLSRKRTSSKDQRRGYERLSSEAGLLQEQELPVEPHTKYTNNATYFKRCIIKQIRNVYHTSILIYEANVNGDRSTSNLEKLINQNPRLSTSSSITKCLKSFLATPSFKYLFKKTFFITFILTVGGITWYAAMALTYASDVTAIYNCSAFTAYAFAIPILNERFSLLKASSVVIALLGVFIVAYSGDNGDKKNQDYPYRLWGNIIVSIGAIMYGLYEVLYKKYACIPEHLAKIITPRRQLTFANFFMCLIGIATFIILLIGILFVEICHIHHFNFFDYGDKTNKIWLFITGSIVSNLIFSASFLSLMALTSPVLSSVSSLLTIFLIGLVEWLMFGNELSMQQFLGNSLVIVGFVLLTTASWKEISEGNEQDVMETASTMSFPISTSDEQEQSV
ncbi:uncharacterized protein PRCAT00002564001 [Priceomyces carsonii]|uniref:uncharacterized protein n=1 Tax=Priceomyces carsonii TaxID=28549 RepID=UPI002ED8438A|nr:unnamed protein product [Priceomyces carsonii]